MIGGSLAAISVLWGLLAFWVFRRFTNHIALRKTGRRIYAHLLEIRLFAEEPALVWKAQKAVIVENFRFLSLVAKPVLILGLPFALLYMPLDSIYGWAPLPIGHSSLVTLQQMGSDDAASRLVTPAGIAVETPPVRSIADHQISWRIRALTTVSGVMQVGNASMRVMTGEQILSVKRRREATAGGGWLEVDYPKADVTLAGISLPWLAWFAILSTCGAIVAASLLHRFGADFVTHKTQFPPKHFS